MRCILDSDYVTESHGVVSRKKDQKKRQKKGKEGDHGAGHVTQFSPSPPPRVT